MFILLKYKAFEEGGRGAVVELFTEYTVYR